MTTVQQHPARTVLSAEQVYNIARSHHAASAAKLVLESRAADARVAECAQLPDMHESASLAAATAEKAKRRAASAAAKFAATLMPVEVVLEWAGSGAEIGTCWIDFDSCANVFDAAAHTSTTPTAPTAPTAPTLSQLSQLTLLTLRCKSLQMQVMHALACLQPGSEPAFASSIKLFAGHNGVALTPDPVPNRSNPSNRSIQNVVASQDAKVQWRELLKLQKASSVAKQTNQQTNQQPLVLSVGLYNDYAQLVHFIDTVSAHYGNRATVRAAFLQACLDKASVLDDVELTFDGVTSMPVMAKLCNKWPSTFADFIPQAYLDDMRFMKLCTPRCVFIKASQRLLNDRTFVRFVLSVKRKHGGSLLQVLPPAMQNEEQIVCWAVWSGGSGELRYASDSMKSNRKVVKYACSVDCMALCHASPQLQCDAQLLSFCFAVCPAKHLLQLRRKLDQAWIKAQREHKSKKPPVFVV